MATATGWGALPISMSFGDSIKELVAELNGPVAQAAKNAAGSIEKEIGTASQKAADRYEKQKWRMEKASKEHTAAEEQHRLKLLEQEKAQTALENAEKDLADAREQGGKKARDAQLRYENAQIKVEKATIATRKASDKLEESTVEVSRATESAEQAFQDMENAQDDAGDSAKNFRDLVREMGQELDETGNKASGFGDKVVSGLGTIGKGALLGVGAKIGTTVMSGVGTAFSKGFGRLQSLEDAEASLQGLGRSSEDIDNIMDSVSQSVTGTAFGLDEAAKSAATFSTLGVKSGEEMDRVMSLLADTTAQSGGELSEISPILNKIVAAGGLNIETYDQLNERATGVGEALSKHLGIPIEEVRDNLADVDFETFATAMEANIGGAAKKSGETFGNAFGNMQAALGRLGEKFLSPAFEMGPAVFGAIGGAFDKLGEELEPVIEQVTEYLAPIMEEFAEKLGPWLEETIENVSEAVKDSVGWIRENADWLKALAVGVGIAVGAWKLFTGAIKLHGIAIAIADKGWKGYIASTKIATAVTKLFNKATKANIIGIIATALIAVGGALVYFFTKTETGREMWEKFTGVLADGWEWVTDKLGGGIEWITEKFDEFTGWITDAWAGLTALFFEGDFTGALRDAFGWEEDNAFVNGILTVRDVLTSIPDLITGITDILFKGDFTGLPFGLEEDSGFVGFLFGIRDAVISAGDFIKKVFDGIWKVAKVTLAVIGTVILTPLMLAWDGLSWAIKAAWENIIKPAWDGLSTAATWLWESVLSPIFTWIGDKWTSMSETLKSVWESIKSAVFDAFTWYVNKVKANFELVTGALSTAWTWLKDILLSVWTTIRGAVFAVFEWYITRLKNTFNLVTGAINTAWTWLKDMLLAVWNKIRELVFTAFNNAVQNVQNIFDRVTGAISNAWTWLRDQLYAGWTWINENVFGALGRGLDTVKGWFQSAVDGIRTIWDGIKSAAAKPVKFVVETVYNNGIRKAWNAVAKFVGLDELAPVALGNLGQYAKGGVLPGYTPGRDPYNFVDPASGARIGLSGGEAIMRPEWTRAVGADSVHAMNAAAIRGGVNGVRRMLGGDSGGFVSAFAKGGVFKPNGDTKRKEEVSSRVVAAQDFVRREHGKRYQWAGVGNPSWDCSGLWSGIVRVLNGGTGYEGRLFNTVSFMANPGAFGFSRGLHGPVTVGVSDDHMAGTLDGINAESASDPKGVQLGGSAWGSDNSYFPNQYTMDSIVGEFISGGAGGGGGFNLGAMVKNLWDSAIEKIGSWTGPGLIGKLPGAMLSTVAGKAWEFIKERVGSFFGGGGEAGNRESWREMAMWAMRREGFNADDPRQVDAMLDQIMSESGGIPDRNQEIVDMNGTGASAGQGLLQIIPGTFADHRDPSLPDDRTDPEANMVAALRYYRWRYGDDLTTMWGHGHGYAKGGIVDLPKLFDTGGVWKDGTMGVNLSGSDEVVFNNRQWQLLKQVLNTVPMLTESQEMMVKEIGAAFLGTDIGYAELANALGSEKLAQQVTDIAFLLGDISRDTEVMAAAQEFQEQTRKSAEDYAAEQASGVLSTFGLEGLVPLGLKLGEKAAEAYAANPVDVSMSPTGLSLTARTFGIQADVSRRGATVVIEAESDDDLIRVKQFKKLAEQVDGLEVQVKRKPKAAVRTRGGVM